ncbi:MAG: ATP-binding protein, partial [Flavobacteriales bacterium]
FFTTKAVGEGTGLGLSIVQGIIEEHNGKIEVLSKPSEGTKFIIHLPRFIV